MWIDKSIYELMEAECKLANTQREKIKIDDELIESLKNKIKIMNDYIESLKYKIDALQKQNELKNRYDLLNDENEYMPMM